MTDLSRRTRSRNRDLRIQVVKELRLKPDEKNASLARKFGVSRTTVGRWRKLYVDGRAKNLDYRKIRHQGRPQRMTWYIIRSLRQIAQRRPEDYKLSGKYWSVAKFCAYVAKTYSLNSKPIIWKRSQMDRLLTKARITWHSPYNRSRFIHFRKEMEDSLNQANGIKGLSSFDPKRYGHKHTGLTL
jgi:transposase-like protein